MDGPTLPPGTLALTVHQPWATLIVAGGKPYEFRKWRAPQPHIGKRIVIHSSVRMPMRNDLYAIRRGAQEGGSSLVASIVEDVINAALEESAIALSTVIPRGCGLGTAVLGEPVRCTEIFKPDSDRYEHHMWAWPMLDVERWDRPVPARGLQGFWRW